jgi:hypothetical protein
MLNGRKLARTPLLTFSKFKVFNISSKLSSILSSSDSVRHSLVLDALHPQHRSRSTWLRSLQTPTAQALMNSFFREDKKIHHENSKLPWSLNNSNHKLYSLPWRHGVAFPWCNRAGLKIEPTSSPSSPISHIIEHIIEHVLINRANKHPLRRWDMFEHHHTRENNAIPARYLGTLREADGEPAFHYNCCGPIGSWVGSSALHVSWVLFVGSLPSHEVFFPGFPVFLPPRKSTFLKCNSILNQGPDWKQAFVSCFAHRYLMKPLLLKMPSSIRFILLLPTFLEKKDARGLKWS